MNKIWLVLLLSVGLQARPNPYVDVTTLGADPTGVKDSLSAVEAAMTTACATKPSGAVVWFPAGKYLFSAPIPKTAQYWCNGLTLQGSGVRATELDFSAGTGYALNYAPNLRNVTTQGFLIVIKNNNALGGIFLGGGNFSDTFRDIYILTPSSSTAIGFDTWDRTIGTAALLTLENFRIDGFGTAPGTAFHFELQATGDQLRCNLCYADGAYIGFYVNGWFLASLNNVAADGNAHSGFFIDNNGTTIVNAASSEGDTGFASFFVKGGAGSVFECDECKTQSFSGNASSFPFNFFNFSGTATLRNPATIATGASPTASLDVNSTPKGITILGGVSNFDKGVSKRAQAIVKVL